MTLALLSEALASVVFAKIRFFRSDALGRFDRWMLDGLHHAMLRRIERMRVNTLGRDHPALAASTGGVNNAEVVLCRSDPVWDDAARREAEILRAALGSEVEVHHIGSTAVDGLSAKPIIDLAIALPATSFACAFAEARDRLGALGYRYIGMRGGHFFEKGPAPVRTHALQAHKAESAVLVMLLHFRDQLRRDDDLRREYAATKFAIATHLPRSRWIYALYKGHWIQEQQWRGLGARGWAGWYISHRRAQAELKIDHGEG